MAAQKSDKKEDSIDREHNLQFCKVCNITFEAPKAYFTHIYSVSHLQRANAMNRQVAPPVLSMKASAADRWVTDSAEARKRTIEIPRSENFGLDVTKVEKAQNQLLNISKTPVEAVPGKVPGGRLDAVEAEARYEQEKNNSIHLQTNYKSHDLSFGIPLCNTNMSETVSEELTMSTKSSLSDAVRRSRTDDVSTEPTLPSKREANKTLLSDPGGNLPSRSKSDVGMSLMATVASTVGKTQSIITSGILPDRLTGGTILTGNKLPQAGAMAPKVPFLPAGAAGMPSMAKIPLLSDPPALGAPKVPSLLSTPIPKNSPKNSLNLSSPGTMMPKVPLLMNLPGDAMAPGSFDSHGPGVPSVPRLEPDTLFQPGPKIPLLRSPSPLSPFPIFGSSFPTPGMGPHHSGPLLPTPGTPSRGPVRPLLELPPSTHSGIRPPPAKSWDLRDADLNSSGIEIKEYHHGVQKDNRMARFDFSPGFMEPHKAASVERQVQPLIIGTWIMKPKQPEDLGRMHSCQICGFKSDDFLLHELHLSGMRHKKMARGLSYTLSCASDSTTFSGHFDLEEGKEPASHSPVFVTGLLDSDHQATASSVAAATSSSSGCFSELEQKLQSHPGPILGINYITEYRYLGGRLEYTCDLCDVEVSLVSDVAEHLASSSHLLQYMRYNDPEVYRSVSEKAFSADCIKEAAEKIMAKCGRQHRARVKLESDDVSLDGRFAWLDLKDESVQPVAALPGHRLSCNYSLISPHIPTASVNNIDSLFRVLALHSCLHANRPPSLTRPLRRMDFINAIGKFEIRSSKDAEVCLQLANFLTIAVINFRRQMLPSLKAIDVSKIEKKLTVLHQSAEAVAQKSIATEATTEFDLAQSESNERSK